MPQQKNNQLERKMNKKSNRITSKVSYILSQCCIFRKVQAMNTIKPTPLKKPQPIKAGAFLCVIKLKHYYGQAPQAPTSSKMSPTSTMPSLLMSAGPPAAPQLPTTSSKSVTSTVLSPFTSPVQDASSQ